MSTSQTERKPIISTWFSSLRRQPKPKKILASKKNLQKSCVDLSSVPTDVKSLPASVTNSPKLKNGFFRDNHFCFSPLKTSTGIHQVNDTNSIDSNDTATKSTRTYSTTSSQSSASTNSSNSNQSNAGQTLTTTTTTTNNGKTFTTITRITKTTVISSSQQQKQSHSSNNRINRIGTIFDDDGKLMTSLDNLDVYKNYANNFRSNIIKNDSASSCSSGSHVNVIHINNNNVVRFAEIDNCNVNSNMKLKPKDGSSVSFLSVCDDNSGKSCKESASINSITNRPFKSSSLDDDIEFIDTSSSLSDIGGVEDSTYNSVDSAMYYNTLPKLPKSCATCKTQQKQQAKSKSEWNISIQKKVFFKENRKKAMTQNKTHRYMSLNIRKMKTILSNNLSLT